MTTQRSITVQCDSPECDRAVAIEKEGDVPIGWYLVHQAKEPLPEQGKAPRRTRFDLCSLDCVATWAIERHAATKATTLLATRRSA